MSCSNKGYHTHVSKDFDRLYCSDSSCRSCSNRSQGFLIEDLLKQLQDQKDKGWQGYEKIVDFYNATIKCLELDRNKLLEQMKLQPGPDLDVLYNKIKKLQGYKNQRQYQRGDFLRYSQIFNSEDRAKLKLLFKTGKYNLNLKNLFIHQEAQFMKIIFDLRDIWKIDKFQEIQQIYRTLGEFQSDVLLNKLKICVYDKDRNEKQSSLSQLLKLKEVQSEFDFHLIQQISFFAPQLQGIIFLNQKLRTNMIPTFQKFDHLRFLKFKDIDFLQDNEKSLNQIRQLELDKLNSKHIIRLSSCFPHLTHFIINSLDMSEKQNNLGLLKNLEFLKINCSYSRSQQIVLDLEKTNLRHLNIRERIEDDSMARIFKLPNLKSLVTSVLNFMNIEISQSPITELKILDCYSEFRQINSSKIESFLQNFRKLKSLFANGLLLNDAMCLSILPSMPDLQVLSLNKQSNFNYSITHESIEIMGKYNKELLYLSLDRHKILDRGAMLIGKYFPKLTYLSAYKCKIGNSGFHYLSGLKNLNSLVVTGNYQKEGAGSEIQFDMMRFINNSKNLKNLKYNKISVNERTLNQSKKIRNQILLSSTRSIDNVTKQPIQTLAYKQNLSELVFSQSLKEQEVQYLPPRGFLEEQEQLFEIGGQINDYYYDQEVEEYIQRYMYDHGYDEP